jgi:hypothetical protein
MVQPKYSPEEALERVKLMMKYDTSKTLNENKQSIKQPINEIAPAALIPGLAAGTTWTGIGAVAAPWAAPTIAGAALLYWLYDSVNNGMPTAAKVQSFFSSCSSQKLKPTTSDSEIVSAAESINQAIEGLGTDEDAIKSAISSMKNVGDLCALKQKYDSRFGDLYEDLDGDIDGTDWKMYVWAPMQTIIEKSISEVDPEGEGKKDGGTSSTGGYKDCAGSYSYGCKADAIAKVQGCLGLVADGKFGPKTQAALTAKGFTSFTDAEVDKICGKTQDQADEFTTQVDADNMDDIMNS